MGAAMGIAKMFASDLDRTLIYSNAAMGDVPRHILRSVEWYKGRIISYMSQASVRLLDEIVKDALFVPVTARTTEQYMRVFKFSEQMRPTYAITSNGGNVLVDGTPDQEWAMLIQERLRSSCEPEVIKAMFDKIASPQWCFQQSLAEGLFYSIKVDRERLPHDELDSFQREISKLGWQLSIQGRKIYLVPHVINKGDAMLFVKERTGAQGVAAAGDSLLDESLLAVADFALAPRHGELFRRYEASGHDHIHFTSASGILAAEQLLQAVHQYVQTGQTINLRTVQL
ncbi:HAD family hydrolase [Paenibacillus sp. 481]|uniref:HAD family hydrolase n=1 Tax=Paenibacillus sp. 481 TaxID=2835869 RepID=UPI001E3EE334|nr:HAD family hydrolase [Paenibacillus sp. 481]UHA74798.1 hypothetical protein KIK04_06985 [Paenibacillus sp. 481]